MSSPRKSLLRRRFGRLVVTALHSRVPGGNSKWTCQCDCGKTHVAWYQHLTAGRTRSCGCARGRRETKGRERGSATDDTWV